MNQIIITGRIAKDLEIKTANSGTELCNFTVAVDRRRKDQNGERQTDFFNCTIFGKGASFITTYFKKGDGINIVGRMESRKYTDKDGNNRVARGVTCDNIEFPHGKKQVGQNDGNAYAPGGEPGGFHDMVDSGVELPF